VTPGDGAGITDLLPLDRNRSWELRAKGKVPSDAINYDAFVYVVTPGYFDAMGMRLPQGRGLTWQDTPTSEPVTVINEAAARREWPAEDPVGQLAEGLGEGDTPSGRGGKPPMSGLVMHVGSAKPALRAR